MKKIKIAVLILTAILLIGCVKKVGSDTKGDTMKFILETNVSEDYTWAYSIMDSNIIDIKSIDYLTPADDQTLKTDAEVLIFKALSEGEVEIIISYTSNQTGESKYDLTYVLEVDADKNIKVKEKSGNYNKEIPSPIIYTEAESTDEE